jgi:hypothetical protein
MRARDAGGALKARRVAEEAGEEGTELFRHGRMPLRGIIASILPRRSRGLDEGRLQTPVCPLLAQSGHRTVVRQCPLLGVKRK